MLLLTSNAGAASGVAVFTRIRKPAALTDGGRTRILVLGGFNATPEEWADSGLLTTLHCQFVTAGAEGTCTNAYGPRVIDYALMHKDLTGPVRDFR